MLAAMAGATTRVRFAHRRVDHAAATAPFCSRRRSPRSTCSRAGGSRSASAPAGRPRSTRPRASTSRSAGSSSTTACARARCSGATHRRRSRRRACRSATSGACRGRCSRAACRSGSASRSGRRTSRASPSSEPAGCRWTRGPEALRGARGAARRVPRRGPRFDGFGVRAHAPLVLGADKSLDLDATLAEHSGARRSRRHLDLARARAIVRRRDESPKASRAHRRMGAVT